MVTGPNGCGKTTLLLLAAGILLPQQGSIELQGEDVSQPIAKKRIGISATRVNLPGFMTANELLQFHGSQFSLSELDTKINQWSERFNFTPFLRTKAANLSLGNQKKLSLILALIHEPQILLLDEPTNGLDDQGLQTLDHVVSEFSGQILMASHDANTELTASMTELPIATING